MSLDLYFKMPEDPSYDDSETEVEDELFQFLQAVEMVLTTRRGDILGEPTFGANLEDFLWNTRLTSAQVASAVRSQVESFCGEWTAKIPWDVQVSFVQQETTDSMIVDVTIDGTKVLGIGVTS